MGQTSGKLGKKKVLCLDDSLHPDNCRLFLDHINIFKGTFEGNIDVAIKVIAKSHDGKTVFKKEVKLLKKLDKAEIIRYRFSDSDKKYLYIAVDLSDGKYLADTVSNENLTLLIRNRVPLSTKLILGPSRELFERENVFSGTFGKNIHVAVKKIRYTTKTSQADIEDIKREVDILKTLDHPNIIRFRFSEADKDFFYIALDANLISSTLQNLLSNIATNVCFFERAKWKIKLLNDIAEGLNYLHDLNIIHGNLVPQNVLIKNGTRAVISNFGLSLKLKEGIDSAVLLSPHAGVLGWMPRELLSGGSTIRKSADIFTFGCLVHFTLKSASDDRHPFGNLNVRETQIRSDQRCCYIYKQGHDLLQMHPVHDYVLGDVLVDVCVNRQPSHRPTAPEILKHPLFWDSKKKVEFTVDIYNEFKSEIEVVDILEANWSRYGANMYGIDTYLLEAWEIYDEYLISKGKHLDDDTRTHELFFLMRLLRDIKTHYYDDFSEEEDGSTFVSCLEEYLGCPLEAEKLVRYFFGRMPPAFPVIYLSFNNNEGECGDYYFTGTDHFDAKCGKAWKTIKHHFGSPAYRDERRRRTPPFNSPIRRQISSGMRRSGKRQMRLEESVAIAFSVALAPRQP